MTPFGFRLKSPAQAPLCPLRNPRDFNPRRQKLKSCTHHHPSFGGLAWGALFFLSALVFPALQNPSLEKKPEPSQAKKNHVRKFQRIRQDRPGYVGFLLELQQQFWALWEGVLGGKRQNPGQRGFFGGKKIFIWGGKEPSRSCIFWLHRWFYPSSAPQALLLLFLLLN